MRGHGAQLHGVAARLKDRQDAVSRPAAAVQLATQSVHRGVDGGGVVGKIIIDRDVAMALVHDPADFHAPLDVPEARKCFCGLLRCHAQVFGSRNRRQGIELVVHAADIPADTGQDLPSLQNPEIVGGAIGCEACACRVRAMPSSAAEEYTLTPATLVQDTLQAGFARIDHDTTLRWHCADEVVKLPFNCRQVLKNIRVVELQVVQHCRARTVVDKFAALVKKGCVVFICLNHECVAGAKPGRHAKIQRNPAHQKARLQACLLQNPGQHGRGCGFAVGAGHRQNVARAGGMVCRVVKDVAGKPLRPTGVRQALVQDGFHQRVFCPHACHAADPFVLSLSKGAPRGGPRALGRPDVARLRAVIGQPGPGDDIADDKYVRPECQLLNAVAFNQFNAEGSQLVAHGWVYAGVAASDLVAGLASKRCQATHESAANSQDMYVHGDILGVCRQYCPLA